MSLQREVPGPSPEGTSSTPPAEAEPVGCAFLRARFARPTSAAQAAAKGRRNRSSCTTSSAQSRAAASATSAASTSAVTFVRTMAMRCGGERVSPAKEHEARTAIVNSDSKHKHHSSQLLLLLGRWRAVGGGGGFGELSETVVELLLKPNQRASD